MIPETKRGARVANWLHDMVLTPKKHKRGVLSFSLSLYGVAVFHFLAPFESISAPQAVFPPAKNPTGLGRRSRPTHNFPIVDGVPAGRKAPRKRAKMASRLLRKGKKKRFTFPQR